jgi:hypothetical protein
MLTMTAVTIHKSLGALSDLLARGEPSYPERVLAWLDETEKALARLRRSEAALLASLRGKLLCARDGLRDPAVPGELTPRKQLRGAAAMYLCQAEELLRSALAGIDEQLGPLRNQLAQLVSAGYLLGLIAAPSDNGEREAWLRQTWSRLSETEQTRGMTVYLRTTLTPVDRLYLLDELLANLSADSLSKEMKP